MLNGLDNVASIQSIEAILKMPLSIPSYQRPYKWQTKHVYALLNDVFVHFTQGKQYRLGTVVLYQNQGRYEIVDGQQRLITLSLLLHCLGFKSSLLQQTLPHSISQYNLLKNYQVVKNFLIEQAQLKQRDFKVYVLGSSSQGCDMVRVVLDDLDEAFQFFDSPNTRGKKLETYDLLKAYHLRDMTRDAETCRAEQKKITQAQNQVYQCVKTWEDAALAAANSPNLHTIINLILFRLRAWRKGEAAEVFTQRHLSLFKGVSRQVNYPYLNQLKSAQALFQAASSQPHLYQTQFSQAFFQINQVFFNGQNFFEYIEHYRVLYGDLFDDKQGYLSTITVLGEEVLDKGLVDFLNHYKHHHRTGDRYLRQLFECTVMLYADKFGQDGLDSFVYKAFVWVYQKRLAYQRIAFQTIDNEARAEDSLLKCIEQALKPSDVRCFVNKSVQKMVFENVDERVKKILGVAS